MMLAEEAMFDSEAVANDVRLLSIPQSDDPAWNDEDHPELAQVPTNGSAPCEQKSTSLLRNRG
jgi:hypothetical protein